MNGRIHRIDGPACQNWNPDGTLTDEEWRMNGKQHRINGPSSLTWDSNGTLTNEEWRTKAVWHRTDGPAVQDWDSNGTLIYEEGYVHGKKTSRRMIILGMARVKVLRASRLLILANAVQCVSADSLSVIGGFLK